MGPDECHTAYPDRDPVTDGRLDDNAYTNAMVAWTLTRTLDVLTCCRNSAPTRSGASWA